MPFNGVYLIGLTGNIACGKSTVLGHLANLGAEVIDADRVTHELQQPGQPVYRAIVESFGQQILVEPGGRIDRARLGAIVFSDPQALRRLEQIVHPAVHQRMHQWLAEVARRAAERRQQLPTPEGGEALPVAVIDAIKLLEAGWKPLCDAIWVVVCPPEQQLERLMRTRGMSEEQARQRIAAQPPQREKVAQADVVIDNSTSLDALQQQVEAAWRALHAGGA